MKKASPLLQFDNVRKVFISRRGVWREPVTTVAVDGISFSLNPGETIALVGESGSGKTTVGRMASGLIKPTDGVINYQGLSREELTKDEFLDYRLSVQMIHQDPYASLNPALTIGKVLSAPLLQHELVSSRKEARVKAEELLARVGLGADCYDKYPHQLSGGQRQRISVARAISVNPRVMVADEPVSMMDVSLRVGLLDLLLDLQDSLGMSYIFITHDLGVVRYFARNQRTFVMYRGHVMEQGSTETVIVEPCHPYTQALRMAVPVPDPKLSRSRSTLPIKNDLDENATIEDGCPFAPRCIYAQAICYNEKPELSPLSDNHWVACFFREKVA